MLRTIRIYGALARFLKRKVFRAQVANAAEAIRFLLANFPELQGHMAEQFYEVRVGSRNLQIGADLGELHLPIGQKEVISIIPVMAGAGGGFGKIAAGIALIAAAIVFAPAGAGFLGLGAGATAGTFTLGAAASMAIGSIGTALALAGVSQILTPTPKMQTSGSDTEIDPRKSYSFSGVQNVSRQGIPIPIVYGEIFIGSVVISAGISTEKVTA